MDKMSEVEKCEDNKAVLITTWCNTRIYLVSVGCAGVLKVLYLPPRHTQKTLKRPGNVQNANTLYLWGISRLDQVDN